MTALVRSELLKVRTTRGWWDYLIVIVLLVGAAVAVPWLSLLDVELQLGTELGKRAAATLFSAVLFSLMGIAVGAAVHSQVAALVGTLLWIFLAETLLCGLLRLLDWDGAVAYLPFRALDGADGSGGGDLLRYWPAVGVSLAWIAAIGAVAAVRTRRRDIT